MVDSQGGSVVEGSEEVLMIIGGGCGEEQERSTSRWSTKGSEGEVPEGSLERP